ncbi:GAF domain-containing protein [Alkalicoccobacillus gibsonii]|uniref:GAF domain-containing protein n=1 Tax=Alkalicoccobacillus gibsonii TaxID=79881 RepID=UPI0035110188
MTESETFKNLDEAMAEQVTFMDPKHIMILLYIILSLAIAWFILRMYKLWKKPDNHIVKELKRKQKETSEDSNQKSLVMTLMDQVVIEVKNLTAMKAQGVDPKELEDYGRKILNLAVSQIPVILKSTKSINHRCAVFTVDPDDRKQLMVLEGSGYSLRGKEKLRLDCSTVAGIVYVNGKYNYVKDVTKEASYKPNPKASKTIYSLICYPIVVNDITVGILSIDGSEKNCFNNDDIAYCKMFTNLFGVIFSAIGYDDHIKLEGDDVDGKIQVTG